MIFDSSQVFERSMAEGKEMQFRQLKILIPLKSIWLFGKLGKEVYHNKKKFFNQYEYVFTQHKIYYGIITHGNKIEIVKTV